MAWIWLSFLLFKKNCISFVYVKLPVCPVNFNSVFILEVTRLFSKWKLVFDKECRGVGMGRGQYGGHFLNSYGTIKLKLMNRYVKSSSELVLHLFECCFIIITNSIYVFICYLWKQCLLVKLFDKLLVLVLLHKKTARILQFPCCIFF